MFVNSLDNKQIITDANGNEIKDLTKSMFNFSVNTNINADIYRVPKNFVMRPDLVSNAAYKDTEKAEFVLKYNGISNPFSIDEDDVILIPDADQMLDNVNTAQVVDNQAEKIRNGYKYIDPLKIPKKDKELNNYEERYTESPDENILPANIAQPDEKQVLILNGKVYFGNNIGTPASNCLRQGMSQSEFMKSVIKNS